MKDEIAENFVKTLFQLTRNLRRLTDYQGGDNHLSAPQVQVMLLAKEIKEPTMSDISTNLNIALPTATTMIDRLVVLGFLNRIADKDDRRVIRIELTKSGEKALSDTIKKKVNTIKRTLSLLPEEDIKNLNRIINTLLTKVENLPK